MKKVKLLGLGLLIGLLVYGGTEVYGESNESTEMEASTEEVVTQESNGEVTEESNAMIETFGAEGTEDQIDENLKIYDAVYNEEKDQIIGKADSDTIIACYSSEDAVEAGIFQVAEDGSFVVIAPPAGNVKIQAKSKTTGKVSAPVMVEVIKKNGEPSLKIEQVVYDTKTKTFSAKTAPNATVHMYVPSTMGEGFVTADESGAFSVQDDFEPGMEVIFTASDINGQVGASYRFVVPEAATTETSSTETTTSSSTVEKTEDSEKAKGWFPHTGENSGGLVSAIGVFLLVFAGGFYKLRVKTKK